MTDDEMIEKWTANHCRVRSVRGAEPGWLLCEHPERVPDDYAHVHLVKCRGCRIGAEMAARLWPERWKLIYDLQTLYWADDDRVSPVRLHEREATVSNPNPDPNRPQPIPPQPQPDPKNPNPNDPNRPR